MRKQFLKRHGRTLIYVASVPLILIVLILVFWVLPIRELGTLRGSLGTKDYLELKSSIRVGLAQAIGGAAILVGLFFTWRNIRATERNLEISHHMNARNLKIAQEGQITERFTHAIDQLGDDKLQVRLGGIYALERIARDSKEDHWSVMEILTAFVRTNSSTKTNTTVNVEEVSADTQAVLTVLSRRNLEHEEGSERLDLRGVQLRDANLIGCHLDRAILWHADLQGANLRDCYLISAGLSKASLKSAKLTSAQLEGATLPQANLEDAICSGANLEGAQLNGANLQGAIFYEANLSGANLFKANLARANLMRANLSVAILTDADLSEANLDGADLTSTIGLTLEQLRSSMSYDQAKLPPKIIAALKS